MSQNVETLRRYVEVLNERGESPLDLLHPDLEIRMFRGSPIRGPYHGHPGHEQWRRDTFDVIEDWRIELDDVVETADPDVMVALERFVGRLRHADLEADFPLAVVVRFHDRRISRFEGYRERAEALEHVGLAEQATSRAASQSSEALSAFSEAARRTNEAFNRQDFESAFAELPSDIEWDVLPAFPGARTLHGRGEVIEFFRRIAADFPDFRAELGGVSEAGPGVFVIKFVNRATGRMSGLEVTSHTVFQVWEVADRPWRVHERESLSDALEAAGLAER